MPDQWVLPLARRRTAVPILALLAGLNLAAPQARAEDAPEGKPLVAVFNATADLIGPVRGPSRAVSFTRNLDLSLDLDLDRTLGWAGGVAHVDIDYARGRPNDRVGSLQWVDGIETPGRRGRLYQAWVEADVAGPANLRLGFSDLSGEFAVVESSAQLINSSFGMAPDFAASGAGAFPSTAAGARLRLRLAQDAYLFASASNATAGVPGDPDVHFDNGAIVTAEAGWTGAGKIAVGSWRLTKRQDDLFATDSTGAPRHRSGFGVYALGETRLSPAAEGARVLTGFTRAGLSDGRTTEFKGSWQSGFLLEPALKARPESSLSIGVTQAWLSRPYRQAMRAAGNRLGRAETVFELAYSDEVTPRLRVQPDLQVVRRPGGQGRTAIVAGLRLGFGL